MTRSGTLVVCTMTNILGILLNQSDRTRVTGPLSRGNYKQFTTLFSFRLPRDESTSLNTSLEDLTKGHDCSGKVKIGGYSIQELEDG